MVSSHKKILFRLVIVVAVIACWLAGMEGYLRHKFGLAAGENPDVFALPLTGSIHQPSSVYGLYWELTPGMTANFQKKIVTINNEGLRDDETNFAPNLNGPRVLCLGDSITFGAHVGDRETFEKKLTLYWNGTKNTRTHRPLMQVINAGVSGYNGTQMAAAFFARWWRFDPDLLVIGFFNDDLSPVYQPPVLDWFAAMEQRFVLYRWARHQWHKLRDTKLDYPIVFGDSPGNAAMRDNLAAFERLIVHMRDRGKKTLFVIHPDFREPELSAQARLLLPLLQQYDVPWIEMMPIYKEASGGHPLIYSAIPESFDPHPNAKGHELIAKSILKKIDSEGLLPKK